MDHERSQAAHVNSFRILSAGEVIVVRDTDARREPGHALLFCPVDFMAHDVRRVAPKRVFIDSVAQFCRQLQQRARLSIMCAPRSENSIASIGCYCC
jgi:hypothetical protein